MLRVDSRLLVGSVALVFLLGLGVGFAVAGTVGGSASDAGPATGGSTPTPEPASAGTLASTPTPTALGTDSPTVTPTPAGTGTTAPTASPTSVPTPTVRPGPTATPTATATRTPMLIRRFEVAAIESEIRRLVNEWRDEQGLSRFALPEGRLVGDLNAMARSHSVAMADAGTVAHTVDNRSSAERYHEFDVYWNCRFKRANHDYIVTPDRNRLELLAQTYAGRAYETADGGVEYNGNETAIARDVVETWTGDPTFRERLSYRNVTRIGIGVELTRDNEAYVTGNLCGVWPRNPAGSSD